VPVAAGAGGLGGFLLRYLASLPFREPGFGSHPVISDQPAFCPGLLTLLEDYIAAHRLGAVALLLAFGVGAGFALGCIVGYSWGACRCFATGSDHLWPPGAAGRAPLHPRTVGYLPHWGQ